jgi:uncharacterized protein (DUF927 family)
VLLVDRPGWHAGRFLLGNKTLGLGSERLMIDVPLRERLPRVSRNGILRQWQQNVAQPCAARSFFVSALCIAFGAPLLRLANVPAAGIHFRGLQQVEADALLASTASIFGSGEPGHGYCRSAQELRSNFIELLAAHADLPLLIDTWEVQTVMSLVMV